MVEYYPNQLSISAINKQFQGLDLVDEDEELRLQDVADKKKRGKGAPKKAKSAGKYIIPIVSLVAHCCPIADSRRAQRKR